MSERSQLPTTPEELERRLLASARLDEEPMPDVVRQGMLAALGAAGVVGGAGAVAGAASGALRRLALVKWLAATGVVATAGLGLYAATRLRIVSTTSVAHVSEAARVEHRALAPAAPSPMTEVSAAPIPPGAPPPQNDATLPESRTQHRRAAPSAATSSDKVTDAASLENEVAALDRARAALAAGQPGQALELLNTYERDFAKGVLGQEATYVRIQALSKSGERKAARDLAARFLARHPSSPHAAQLQALISP